MITIKIDTRDLDRLHKKVSKFEKSFNDLTPLWLNLAVSLREYQTALFANQGFGKWPTYEETMREKADSYREWKNSKYPGSGINLLQLSKRLYRSLTSKTSDSKIFISPKRFEFGTKVPWAVYHNEGIRVAKRSVLEMSPEIQAIFKNEAYMFATKKRKEFFK